MTGAEARAQRKRLEKEIATELRRSDRQKLATLRAALKAAKTARRERLREIRQACRATRQRLKEQARELRAERAAQRTSCTAGLELEQNEPEIWAMREEMARDELEALERQERAHAREMRKASRYRRTAERMAADLEPIPF